MKQAIGERNNAGNLKLRVDTNTKNITSGGESCRAVHLVQKITLDMLFREEDSADEVIGFMNVDCEGCEPSALMG